MVRGTGHSHRANPAILPATQRLSQPSSLIMDALLDGAVERILQTSLERVQSGDGGWSIAPPFVRCSEPAVI